LQAVERLLERNPDLTDEIRYIQVAIPSRGALAHLPHATESGRHDSVSRLGFWLMFLGFNFAFFPTTLRRSHAFLTEPLRLLSTAVGPEVSLGVIMFMAGTVVSAWTVALTARGTGGEILVGDGNIPGVLATHATQRPRPRRC
jgi:hypothetical protein